MRECKRSLTDRCEHDPSEDNERPKSGPRSNIGPRGGGKHGRTNIKIGSKITNDKGEWRTVRRMRDRPIDTKRIAPIAVKGGATEHVINDH